MTPVDSIKTKSHYAKDLPSRDALLIALHEREAAIEALRVELETKQSELERHAAAIESKDQHIEALLEDLRLARHQRFGKSSEKTDPNQRELFNEAERLADMAPPSEDEHGEEPDDDKPKRQKKKGRKGLNPDLPRERIEHLLSDEERTAAICNTFFSKVKEELNIVPAKAYVLEHWQEKAVIEVDGEQRILAAPRPRHPLGKCIAGIELLAWIIVSKYADALPLYRQESILKRCSADITRTAMAQWVIRLAVLLEPLLKVLHAQQMQASYLQGDETRIQVHKEPGKSPSGDKQMWVLRSLGTGPPNTTESQKPIITFHYDPTRSGSVVERLIEDFEGSYFQSDGYSAYNKPCAKKELTQLGCWDHARRKFKDAEKALSKKNKTGAPAKCTVGLSLVNKLYAIERKLEKLPLDEKHAQRQKLSVPALTKLHDWLEHNVDRVPKDGKTGQAIHYTLNQWDKLKNYTMSPELKISNVLAENAIRPFVIGRKNWLFADTPKGAHASACFYSLIETAKANGVEPYAYLKYVIGNIANAETVEDLEALLPWNMS